MLRCVILALAFTTLGTMAHAEDDPAQFMAAVRAKAAAQPAPAPAPPSLDLAGLAQLLGALSTMPEGGLRRDAERTTRAVLRQARGLSPVRGRAQQSAVAQAGLQP